MYFRSRVQLIRATCRLILFLGPARLLADQPNGANTLKGTWKSKTWHVNGNQVDDPKLEYTFLRQAVEVRSAEREKIVGVYAATDRELDLTFRYASGEMVHWKGVYEVRNSELRLCFPTKSPSDRPLEISVSPGLNVMVLTR